MNPEIESEAIALINRIGSYSLPIDVHEIAQHMKYSIKTYSCCRNLFETLGLTQYAKEHPAISLKYKDNYYIFISDGLGLEMERVVIAHEIGHIRLHHFDSNGVFGRSSIKEISEMYETEADEFAFYLLAPLPMIASHKIENLYDIKRLTMLSIVDCKKIFVNLVHYKEERFITTEREKLHNYYERHIKNLERNVKYNKHIILLIILLLLYSLTVTVIALI